MMHVYSDRLLQQPITTSACVRSLFEPLAALPHERAGFAYLDPDWRLLGIGYSDAGGRDAIDVTVRDIARKAIALDAAHVVMAHNHPSGDPTPSRADIVATKRIATALDTIGVGLAEHLVLAAGGATSLRAEGLL